MGEGRWARALHRLTVSDEERESEQLQSSVAEAGAEKVTRCGAGRQVCVAGEVRSVRLDSRGASPVLEAELYDGTGTVTLVFLGRTGVPGITTGRTLSARGRLVVAQRRRLIYNPAYDLLVGQR